MRFFAVFTFAVVVNCQFGSFYQPESAYCDKSKAPWLSSPVVQELEASNCSYTMFHPTSKAIRNFVKYFLRTGRPLTRDFINDIIQYHVFNGTHYAKDFHEGHNIVWTFMNESARVNKHGDGQVLNVINTPRHLDPHNLKVSFGIPDWPKTTANVVWKDIKCRHGVVHFVDKVFWFPRYASATLRDGEAGSYSAAVSTAAVQHILDIGSNMTFFVPLNTVMEGLLGPAVATPATIKGVLLTHMAHGTFYSSDLHKLDKHNLKMLDGKAVAVDEQKDHTFKIGGAQIVMMDVLVRNGVMHVVDNFIKPKANDLPQKMPEKMPKRV